MMDETAIASKQSGTAVSMDVERNDALIQKAKEDPEAFVELYRGHYDMVFRYCIHRLLSRDMAEEMTSRVFFKVIDKLTEFKGEYLKFRSWLYAIATNEINSHFRKTARRRKLIRLMSRQSHDQTAECPSMIMDTVDRQVLVRQALFTLKPKYQTIITLRFMENLTTKDIAAVLSLREGTVRSQLTRGLKHLREKLEPVWQEISP